MRALTTIILCFLIVLSPSWIYLPVLFGSILFHPFYLEGIVAGLIIDTLYGISNGAPLFGYTFGFLSTVTIILVTPLRKYIRFNA